MVMDLAMRSPLLPPIHWTGGAARQGRRRSFHRFFAQLIDLPLDDTAEPVPTFFLDRFGRSSYILG
jgi:hypothetical protein